MPTSARPPSGGILPECNSTNGLPERSNPGGEAAYAAWFDVGIDPYGLAAQRFVGADAHIGPNPPSGGILPECNSTNGLPERSNPGGEAAYAAWVDVGIDPYGLAAQRFVGADAHIGPNPPPAGLLQQIFNLHINSLNSI